jgi:guanosine-3',5'-bis(diphosphate) 3'-pyrophosphohydrolase
MDSSTAMTHGRGKLQTLIHAAAFAADKHRDQRRKDAAATPYINHPLALARILSAEGGVTDVATLCAALLHDTLEDTKTSADELEREFGAEVRRLVEEVSDDKSLAKAERKRLQIEHAAHISDKAKLVKLADKIANLRDVADSPPHRWTRKRQQDYFDWAKQVVDRMRGAHPVLERAFDAAYALKPEAARRSGSPPAPGRAR